MELLSPAGNMEKLKAAVAYGADAVYFGGEAFGLRAFAGNFTLEEIKEAMKYLHERGKKGYLTINAYARDSEISALKEYLVNAASAGVDAFIISDPGVFKVASEVAPSVDRHISTQANTTNASAVNFWAGLGAKRVILARELARDELRELVKNAKCEVETFVHGAVCISYSGRCLVSAYLTGRDANRGECTQPCRWNYKAGSIQEATRPMQNMDIIEDESGTYLYNAKDLCLIDRVGELLDMGVSSIKIEGRMKSVMYAAIVTGVYRKAIDKALEGKIYQAEAEWKALLDSVSNRHYTEGFYAGVPDNEAMNYETSAYVRLTDFLGVVESHGGGYINVDIRGKFAVGEKLEIVTPGMKRFDFTVKKIADSKGNELENSRSSEKMSVCGDWAGEAEFPAGSIIRRVL